MEVNSILKGIKGGSIVSNVDSIFLENYIKNIDLDSDFTECLCKGTKKVYISNNDCTYIIVDNDIIKGIYYTKDMYELDYFAGNVILSSDKLTTLINIHSYDYYDIVK